MRIGIVQISPVRGNIERNISNHLYLIEQIIKLKADLIIFPELSLTGYEPTLAESLAVQVDDARLTPFQAFADKNEVAIGVGAPTKATDGVNISMLIFQAYKERSLYTKSLLHEDELPYFTSGKSQPSLQIKGEKVALGICYETLQRAHFEEAVNKQADIYIASVAKPDRGLNKAYLHFPSIAQEFHLPVLMANCVGFCDNFLSNGKSAVWNSQGKLVEELDTEKQGFILYDTKRDEAKRVSL